MHPSREKLIRDRIPELAAAQGRRLVLRTADPVEMARLLGLKLVEETHDDELVFEREINARRLLPVAQRRVKKVDAFAVHVTAHHDGAVIPAKAGIQLRTVTAEKAGPRPSPG